MQSVQHSARSVTRLPWPLVPLTPGFFLVMHIVIDMHVSGTTAARPFCAAQTMTTANVGKQLFMQGCSRCR
jgi:hypothetical protein